MEIDGGFDLLALEACNYLLITRAHLKLTQQSSKH